ncbi:MAG: hypothetical protein ACOC53_02510 [Candidatus Saliniplasma sp.]
MPKCCGFDIMNKHRTKLSNEGALEGLPLYLILLVVIAGIGTAIIVGWMTSAQSTELDTVEIDEGDRVISSGSNNNVKITAYDQNGNGLQGVVITLEGCDVVETGETGPDGTFTFERMNPSLSQNQNFGEIEVTAKYTGDVTTVRSAVITVQG